MSPPLKFGIALVIGLAPAFCSAADLHVDNALGRDRFHGTTLTPSGALDGPVRTIQRALFLARPGDRIIIANTGIPYYEALSISGPWQGGYPGIELTIIGNGATISGARPVPSEAWRELGNDLWSFTPFRKGTYFLLVDGQPVPEIAAPPERPAPPELPAGHWCAWRGTIYYRSAEIEDPRTRNFSFASEGVGLSLFNARHVVIENLTFEHFRQDGVHVHDLCRDVTLIGVTCRENGRAGVAASGTSTVRILSGRFSGNRLHDVLLRGDAAAAIEVSTLEKPPVMID